MSPHAAGVNGEFHGNIDEDKATGDHLFHSALLTT